MNFTVCSVFITSQSFSVYFVLPSQIKQNLQIEVAEIDVSKVNTPSEYVNLVGNTRLDSGLSECSCSLALWFGLLLYLVNNCGSIVNRGE